MATLALMLLMFVLGLAVHGIVRALLPLLPRCGFKWDLDGHFGPHTCARARGHVGAHRCTDGKTCAR